MKNLKLFVFALCTMLLAVLTVSAANNELPAADDKGVITLTGDITLDATFKVNAGQNITIDLAGYTLTGPSNGYTINNEGSLMIKDSGSTKGKIVGVDGNNSSTVRNNGSLLQISGVTIESPFICVKNEPDKVAIINNSSLTSTSTETYTAILNYGDLAATDSTITGTNRAGAVLAVNSDGATKNSKTTLTNCTISGDTPLATDTDSTIIMDGGSLEGKLDINQKGNLQVKGEVEAKLSSNITRYLQSGANLTISGDDVISQGYEINEGVTLTIKEDAKLNFIQKFGNLTYVGYISVKGGEVVGTVNGAKVYNESNTTYYGLLEQALINTKADTTNNLVLLDDTDESTTVWNKENKLNNNKDVNLDLNGHTLKGDLVNNVDKTLTIVDETGEGDVVGTITNKGTLTIENGNYSAMPTTEEGATTTLNGGTYPTEELKNATIPEDKELVENEDGTYSIIDKIADFTKLDEAIADATEALKEKEKYTEESVKALEEALKADNEELRASKVSDQDLVDEVTKAINDAISGLKIKEVNAEVNVPNPDTYDASMSYMGLALLSLGTMIVSIKKLKNN